MPITREFINGRISFSVRTPKRKGITTLAVKIPLFYKEGRKSLTTIGFFKKSGDIFFGATSQKLRQKAFFLTRYFFVRKNHRSKKRSTFMSLIIHNYSLLCMEKLFVCSLCATVVLEVLFWGKPPLPKSPPLFVFRALTHESIGKLL